ncbi:hypothetical protein LMG24238_00373 [Paraburkholderia sediminicola]|uniref:Uncharacterized protein n=1 Tax=Paraburkholderia sediminicola TaxID=458836 RepID=A0A6J4ZT04_9BURK|nr:hypothetical protein LMG24238_00373 [Paraburkholderia sediminicola]
MRIGRERSLERVVKGILPRRVGCSKTGSPKEKRPVGRFPKPQDSKELAFLAGRVRLA